MLVQKMAQFLTDELTALGAHVEQRPLGKQPGKEHLELPPVVVARYGNDPNKRTILVYGHYDVQPALKEDGWATEPFELTIDEKDRMYGRGSTDDKGPVLGWLNVIDAHRKAGVEFPVNLLCCFEGMEEYGSEGLDDFIKAEAGQFFKDADAVCISDNYWLGTEKPCLTYGLRGCNYYSLSISGPAQDLHSGVFGGSAHEPMTDLVTVLSKLVDPQGNILIPGLMDLVAPVTEEEKSLYGGISYTMDNLHESLGAETGIHPTKERTLMARWRYPSLSIHGVEGAYSAPGAKTVIPAKVIGKFSIRTVPNMESEDVNKLVFDHVKAEFAKLNSKNKLDVWLQHDGKWWVASPKHWNFSAASKAVEQVFGVAPDMTREGGRYVHNNCYHLDLGINIETNVFTVSPSLSLSSRLLARTSSSCPWVALLMPLTLSTRSWTAATTLRVPSCWALTCTTLPRSPQHKWLDVKLTKKIHTIQRPFKLFQLILAHSTYLGEPSTRSSNIVNAGIRLMT